MRKESAKFPIRRDRTAKSLSPYLNPNPQSKNPLTDLANLLNYLDEGGATVGPLLPPGWPGILEVSWLRAFC